MVFQLTISSILRDSVVYLPRYFSQIEKAFELRGGQCHAIWLEGDSKDETYSWLLEAKNKLEALGHVVTLIKFDLHGPHWSSLSNDSNRWMQLATCWNTCLEQLLPSKYTVCVESDLIWEPSVIETLIGKLDMQHHVICPMLLTESSLEVFGFERFYDTWGFSRAGKKFLFYPPYWSYSPHLIEEKELLQVSTGGGMLVSTYQWQRQGKWAMDSCIMRYPDSVKVFLDKTVKIYHPAPAKWNILSRFAIHLKILRYKCLIGLKRLLYRT